MDSDTLTLRAKVLTCSRTLVHCLLVLPPPVGQHELKKFKQCFTQIDLEYVLAVLSVTCVCGGLRVCAFVRGRGDNAVRVA